MNLPPEKNRHLHPFQPPSPTLHERSSSPYLATKRACVCVYACEWLIIEVGNGRAGRKWRSTSRRIAETARLAASPIGRFALGPRRGRARRPLPSFLPSSKRRRHLAASFRNLEAFLRPPPLPRRPRVRAARSLESSNPNQPRFLTVPSTGFVQGGLVIRAKGGDAILSAAGSARRAFGKSRDGTRGLWPLLPRSWKRDGLGFGRRGASIEYWRPVWKEIRPGEGRGGIIGIVRGGISRWRNWLHKFCLLKNSGANLTKIGKFLLAYVILLYVPVSSISPINFLNQKNDVKRYFLVFTFFDWRNLRIPYKFTNFVY